MERIRWRDTILSLGWKDGRAISSQSTILLRFHYTSGLAGFQRSTSIVSLALKRGHFLYFLMSHRCSLSDTTYPSTPTARIPPHDAPQSMSLKARLRLWAATTL